MALPNIVQSDLTLQTLLPDNSALVRLLLPVTLTVLQNAVPACTNYAWGFPVDIRSVRFIATIPATTPGATVVVTPTLSGVAMTTDTPPGNGGELTLTTAGCGAGEITEGLHISGNNRLVAGGLTLTAATAAPFTEGAGFIEVMAFNLSHRHVLAILSTMCQEF